MTPAQNEQLQRLRELKPETVRSNTGGWRVRVHDDGSWENVLGITESEWASIMELLNALAAEVEWRPIESAPPVCIVGWLEGVRVVRAEAAKRGPLGGWYTPCGLSLHGPTHFIDMPQPPTGARG